MRNGSKISMPRQMRRRNCIASSALLNRGSTLQVTCKKTCYIKLVNVQSNISTICDKCHKDFVTSDIINAFMFYSSNLNIIIPQIFRNLKHFRNIFPNGDIITSIFSTCISTYLIIHFFSCDFVYRRAFIVLSVIGERLSLFQDGKVA